MELNTMEPEKSESEAGADASGKSKLSGKDPHVWGNVEVGPGEGRVVQLVVSESFSGLSLPIPVFVKRSLNPGPVVFVTAAIHGDEINGTGAIRELITDPNLGLIKGTLILVPVVNITGFDRHSRYLPDRRDLNRCFPGSKKGSLASRMARIIFQEIVGRCDLGIDLHTASIRRTNFPNVRADMHDPAVSKLALAFGSELIVDGQGPDGAFRREACKTGCPTIVLEAGEVWKVEPAVVRYAIRGIRNVLSTLGMIEQPLVAPAWQMVIRKSTWVRANLGGFLQFHVTSGDLVRMGEPLATNSSLTGSSLNTLESPFDAIVLGMTTLPAISPGDPVCNLASITATELETVEASRLSVFASLEEILHDELATKIMVVPVNPENSSGHSNGNQPASDRIELE